MQEQLEIINFSVKGVKTMKDYSIRRGDVIWLIDEGEPVDTHVLQKTRPAVVVSTDVVNQNCSTVVVAPMTHNSKRETYITTSVLIDADGDKSYVCCDQIRVVDKSRIGGLITHLSDDAMEAINKAVKATFSLDSRKGKDLAPVATVEEYWDVEDTDAMLAYTGLTPDKFCWLMRWMERTTHYEMADYAACMQKLYS